jgi:hypothetical protein
MRLFSLLFITLISYTVEISSQEINQTTYEIEVLIYETPNSITDEIFADDYELDVSNKEFIQLTSPPIVINSTALKNSFNFEYKYDEVFEKVDAIKLDNSEDQSYSSNPGYWYRELKSGTVLNSLKRRILRRSDYKLLAHHTWHQGAINRSNSPFVYLSDKSNYAVLIKMYKSRYLHIDIQGFIGIVDIPISTENKNVIKRISNIFFQRGNPKSEPAEKSETLDEELKGQNFIKYMIDEDIRVFPNEVYYFDHPKFGIVVSIKDKL